MSAQSDNHDMEGVQDPATDVKGKGRAQEGDVMEESNDDDSSDESGVEDHVRSPFPKLSISAQTANTATSGRRGYDQTYSINARTS